MTVRMPIMALVVLLAVLWLPSSAAAQRLQYFSAGLPQKAVIRDMATGPDQAIWFTLNSRAIGRIALDGGVTLYRGLTAPATRIVLGDDGHLWFIEPTVDRIGRIAPGEYLVEYETPGILRAATDFFSRLRANLAPGRDGVWISGEQRAAHVGTDGTVRSVAPCDASRPLITGLGAWSAGALVQCVGDVDPPYRVRALSVEPTGVTARPAPVHGRVRFLGPGVLFGVRGDPESEPRVLRREQPSRVFDRIDIQWPRRLLGDREAPAATKTDVWFTSRSSVSRTLRRFRDQSAVTRYVARIDSSGRTTPFYLDRRPWRGDCDPCPSSIITALAIAPDGAVWFADPPRGVGRLEPSAATVIVPDRYLAGIRRGRVLTLPTENVAPGTRLVARWTPRRMFRTRRPLGPAVIDRVRVRDGTLRLTAPRRDSGFNLTISRGSVRLVDVDVFVGDRRKAQ